MASSSDGLGCSECRHLVGRFHCGACGFDGGRSVGLTTVMGGGSFATPPAGGGGSMTSYVGPVDVATSIGQGGHGGGGVRTKMQNIRETADNIYGLANQLASEQGANAIVIVIAPDGAYQLRSGPLDINVMVGVLMRSVHVVMLAKVRTEPPGEAVFEQNEAGLDGKG